MIEPLYYTGTCLSPPVTQLGWYEKQGTTLSGRVYDFMAWRGAYLKGYREPNYPLPVTLQNSDTAIGWSLLSCPHDRPCQSCVENWVDQMIYDFPFIEGE